MLCLLPEAAQATSLGLERTASKSGIRGPETEEFIGKLLAPVIQFTGVIFLVLMIYAGFTWMTAGGNEEKIKKAKTTIVAAVVGIVIVMSSFYIVDIIIKAAYSGLKATPSPSAETTPSE